MVIKGEHRTVHGSCHGNSAPNKLSFTREVSAEPHRDASISRVNYFLPVFFPNLSRDTDRKTEDNITRVTLYTHTLYILLLSLVHKQFSIISGCP